MTGAKWPDIEIITNMSAGNCNKFSKLSVWSIIVIKIDAEYILQLKVSYNANFVLLYGFWRKKCSDLQQIFFFFN